MDSTPSSLIVATVLIASTQLVLTLYGAGLRRPFGSLRTVSFMPIWLRSSDLYVFPADLAFLALIVSMWVIILSSTSVPYALVTGLVFYMLGDHLAHRIDLKKSFFISVALSCLSIGAAVLLETAR
ncbi:hypothetical protein [Bradyrhizobium liaoningense]|uniref:hypothetical protein n=1 Tax=Bradyrhizobium liaoningense TaxID=43992 RepID=UPI001BA90084|nr:hypothetical protein [Bradyrhizobium liaoningense]MBR0856648.1 hypothetical protein [Bradyrhizobium liaoningense]